MSFTAGPVKKTVKLNKKSYGPDWVCYSCGIKHGGWYQDDGAYIGPKNHCATYHHGVCEVCGTTNIAVTEPRDYGHLTRNLDGIVLK
jgi:hypothetical protein